MPEYTAKERETRILGEQLERELNETQRVEGTKLLSRCSNELTGMFPAYFHYQEKEPAGKGYGNPQKSVSEHKQNVKGLLNEINIFLWENRNMPTKPFGKPGSKK